MAYHYCDVAGMENEIWYVKGYELGWDISILMDTDYENYNRISLADMALRLSYALGRDAQKHADEAEKAGAPLPDVPGQEITKPSAQSGGEISFNEDQAQGLLNLTYYYIHQIRTQHPEVHQQILDAMRAAIEGPGE